MGAAWCRQPQSASICVHLRFWSFDSSWESVEQTGGMTRTRVAGEPQLFSVHWRSFIWRTVLVGRLSVCRVTRATITRATNERPRIPLTQFPCHPSPASFDKRFGQRNWGQGNGDLAGTRGIWRKQTACSACTAVRCTRGNVGSITWFRVGLAVSMRGSPRRLDSAQLFPQSAFALDLRDSTPLPLGRKRLRQFLNRR